MFKSESIKKVGSGGITCLSSLSSRAVSFFCFLKSSRFLRASARSLTALSLSRLRLSHNVLRDTQNPNRTFFFLSHLKHQMINRRSLPYALPFCHYLVPLLEGPVTPTLGHLGFLQGFFQFLGDGFTLLPQHINLLVCSLHVQSSRVLFLRNVEDMYGVIEQRM